MSTQPPAVSLFRSTARGQIRFGPYELDLDARRLTAEGQLLTIGSRAFDLLSVLVQRAPDPVSGDELLSTVWPGRQAATSSVRVQVVALRRLLGDGVIVHEPARGYRLAIAVAHPAAAETETPHPVPGNLPSQVPAIFDRERERAQLGALLPGQARVTLTGPAGVGKTLLALATAHDRSRAHAAGAWWIDLAPLGDEAQVADRIAATLGLALAGEPATLTGVARALAADDRLLVLDNAEHLVGPVSELADALLRHAPQVALLITSRRPVKCAGEQVVHLGALSLPTEAGLAAARRSGAVALFESRAQRAEPGFALSEATVDAAVAVCRQLDGVPLAIGLAAARVPLLGVAGLRDRLADRLRLLTSRETDSRGHPRALQAALDWSHGLLPTREQAVLRRLGVFVGSIALQTAQAVLVGLPAGDAQDAPVLDDWGVLEALNHLHEHSLLSPVPGALEGTAPARFTLHESVRLYARERLAANAEHDALHRRHARALLARATGQHGLAGDQDPPRLGMKTLLEAADHDDLRAAWAWAAEHDVEIALRLAHEANGHLRRGCHHRDALEWQGRLLADPRAAAFPRRLARLRVAMMALSYERNRLDEVLAHAREAIALVAGDPHPLTLAEAHGWTALVHHSRRELALAEQAYRCAMALYAEAGNKAGIADTLSNLGLLLVELQRHAEAEAMLLQAADHQRGIGSAFGLAVSSENLGEAAWARGDFQAARQHWQQACAQMREIGNQYHESMLLTYLALAERRAGRAEEAHALLRVSLSITRPRQLNGLVADALTVLGALAADGADLPRAARLWGLAEHLRGSGTLTGPLAVDLPPLIARVQAALGARDWHAARLEGARWAPESVLV